MFLVRTKYMNESGFVYTYWGKQNARVSYRVHLAERLPEPKWYYKNGYYTKREAEKLKEKVPKRMYMYGGEFVALFSEVIDLW